MEPNGGGADLDEWMLEEDGDEGTDGSEARPRKTPMTDEEKTEKRRQHFQKARRRAKANKKSKGIKRDYTWKDEPLESIAFSLPVVVIDLSYCSRMRHKEVVSVANQVQQCYGRNRKAAAARAAAPSEEARQSLPPPVALHLLGDDAPDMARVFVKHEGFERWKLFRHSAKEKLTDAFEERRIVVLSPESPNVLEELDREDVYVIGGISDNQNDMKGTTLLSASHMVRLLSFLFICASSLFCGVKTGVATCAAASTGALSRSDDARDCAQH